MPSREELVRGYATAVLAIADAEDDPAVVGDELFAFAKAVEANPRLRDALVDPGLPAENRMGVVRDLLGAKASPHTVNIVELIVDQGRARDLGRIIGEVAEMAAQRRQQVLAEVRSAVPLDEERRAGVAAALSQATGRSVEVKVVVDPSVVGGLTATVGDEVFDGTVQARLLEAARRLRGLQNDKEHGS